MEEKEDTLIRKAQRGDAHAFEKLVYKYDERVMQVIFSMLNDPNDSKDAYQEVFLKVFKSIHKFRFKSEFYTWLYRIVINTCINYRKRKQRHACQSLEEILEESDKNWTVVDPNALDPESQFANIELSEKIETSLNKLSDKQKTVFVLRHYHGHKLKQIAEIMNCSEGTVKNYLFRSTHKLKKQLKEYQLV